MEDVAKFEAEEGLTPLDGPISVGINRRTPPIIAR